jgi:hypothetical protein
MIVIVVVIAVAVMSHVIHGATVPFLEAFAEFSTILSVDWGTLEDVMIVGVGVAVIHVIAASGFNTFTEALPLGVAITIGSPIPVAIAILVLILRSTVLRRVRGRWWFLGRRFDCRGRGDAEGKSWN